MQCPQLSYKSEVVDKEEIPLFPPYPPLLLARSLFSHRVAYDSIKCTNDLPPPPLFSLCLCLLTLVFSPPLPHQKGLCLWDYDNSDFVWGICLSLT